MWMTRNKRSQILPHLLHVLRATAIEHRRSKIAMPADVTTLGSKRTSHNLLSNREEKKRKETTMAGSAEERLAKAKAFVEKDIAEHKVVVYAKTW